MRRSKAWQAEIDKRQKVFDDWLLIRGELLNQFMEEAPPSLRAQLDFSESSLDRLEAWLLEQYPQSPEVGIKPGPVRDSAFLASIEHDPSQYLNHAMLYIGEVLIRELPGARWHILVDNPKADIFDVPLITGASEPPYHYMICPLNWVFACLSVRTGSSLNSYLTNCATDIAQWLKEGDDGMQ